MTDNARIKGLADLTKRNSNLAQFQTGITAAN
jgi:hypothetical protein